MATSRIPARRFEKAVSKLLAPGHVLALEWKLLNLHAGCIKRPLPRIPARRLEKALSKPLVSDHVLALD